MLGFFLLKKDINQVQMDYKIFTVILNHSEPFYKTTSKDTSLHKAKTKNTTLGTAQEHNQHSALDVKNCTTDQTMTSHYCT